MVSSNGWRTFRASLGPNGVRGADDGVTVHILEAASAGPRVVVLGGVHGDEHGGVLAAGRLLSEITALHRGSLLVVPVTHEAAYRANTRLSPFDGLNLAREFPGDSQGSPTQRLAALITSELIEGADLLIDLHTAGARYDMPRYIACNLSAESPADLASLAAAREFGFQRVLVGFQDAGGRTVSTARSMGVATISTETLGGLAARPVEIDAYASGVRRVLAYLQMDDPTADVSDERVEFIQSRPFAQVEHTPVGGFFIPKVGAGDDVKAGDCIGWITDISGQRLHRFEAVSEGVVVMLRRDTRIEAGEEVFRIGTRIVAPSHWQDHALGESYWKRS